MLKWDLGHCRETNMDFSINCMSLSNDVRGKCDVNENDSKYKEIILMKPLENNQAKIHDSTESGHGLMQTSSISKQTIQIGENMFSFGFDDS